MTHTMKKLTRCAAFVFALAPVGLGAALANAQTVQVPALKLPASGLQVDEFTPVRAGGARIELPWCVLKVVAILPGSSLWGSVPPALRSPLVSLGSYDR